MWCGYKISPQTIRSKMDYSIIYGAKQKTRLAGVRSTGLLTYKPAMLSGRGKPGGLPPTIRLARSEKHTKGGGEAAFMLRMNQDWCREAKNTRSVFRNRKPWPPKGKSTLPGDHDFSSSAMQRIRQAGANLDIQPVTGLDQKDVLGAG